MTDLDERLIRAIRQSDADTFEPRAFGEPDPDAADSEATMPEGFGGMGPPPAMHGGPQTGPKGVMADYRYQQQLAAEDKRAKHADYLAKIDRQALRGGSTTAASPEDEDDDATLDELDAELEAEVLDRYRQMRLDDMVKAGRSQQLPTFGAFREIGVSQFLKEVDEEHKQVSVVVHVYEPYIPECQRLNRHLTELATRYGHAKFLRIRAAAADPDLDHLALPVLQVYRAGDLVANLIRATDDMEEQAGGNEAFDVDDCEAILLSHGALSARDECPMDAAAATAAKRRAENNGAEPSRRLRGLEIDHGRRERDLGDGDDESDDDD
ncbi:hypothetical protein H9P43_003716 [Blastocladiella emersonii ATCC 22665]|nr:hypothetical protein H9P43_003716 [Blastocladiella emersonii ATCC 22665]